MTIPVDVTFRGLDPSPAVQSLVEDQVQKLGRYRADMLRCHVVLEQPGHRERGNPYHITIYMSVPGEDIVVSHEPQVETALRRAGEVERVKSTEVGMQAKDVRVAVNEAFKRARRRLEDHARRQRGQVKTHVEQPQGRIARLFPDYGFIQTSERLEIYFHRNSLLNADFDQLTPGARVAFVEEQGEEGPQASSVRVLD